MHKTPLRVAGIIFLIVGLAHLSRLVFQFHFMIGDYTLPIWFNGLAGIVTLGLSSWMFRSARKS